MNRTVRQQFNAIRRIIKTASLRNRSESDIQETIVYILSMDPKYSHLRGLWSWDSTGSIKLTMNQAIRAKILGRRTGQPDFMMSGLFVHNANIRAAGFYIELKKPNFKLRKKNGHIVTQNTVHNHIYKQWRDLETLRNHGCYAQFAHGIEDFFRKLDHFLNNYRLVSDAIKKARK